MRGRTKTKDRSTAVGRSAVGSSRCSASSQVHVEDKKKSNNPFLLSTSSSATNLPSVRPINKLTQHLTNFKLVTTPQLGLATASGRHGYVNLQVT